VPADPHQHVGGAGVFRCHTLDFDGFPLPERGYDFGRDALGLKRESDFVIEVVIPPNDLLFRSLIIAFTMASFVDSVLPDGVFLGFLHREAIRSKISR
jgi:hypothetical protein